MKPWMTYREEAGGDDGGGGGISATVSGGDVDPGGGGDDDSPYSFYQGDKGERTLRPEIAKVFEGDDHKQAINLLMKYANSEDPMKEFSKGVTNLNFLGKRKDIDMLMELPDDAPDDIKAERQDALRKLNGTPDTADGYGLKRPEDIPDNVYWPEGIEQKHMELAHKYNVSPEFLREQFAMHTEMMNGVTQYEEGLYNTAMNTQMDALKAEFGADLQDVIDQADRGGLSSGAFTDEQMAEAMKAMTKAGLGVEFVKHMKWTADSISEDRRVSAPSQRIDGGMNDFAKGKDILDNEHNPLNKAYWDSNHPKHDEAVSAASNFNKAGHERIERG